MEQRKYSIHFMTCNNCNEEMRSTVTIYNHKIVWENSKIITTKSAVPSKMLSRGLAIVIAPTIAHDEHYQKLICILLIDV